MFSIFMFIIGLFILLCVIACRKEISPKSKKIAIIFSIVLTGISFFIIGYFCHKELVHPHYYENYYKEKVIKAENIEIKEEGINNEENILGINEREDTLYYNCIISFTDEFSIERNIKIRRDKISFSEGNENLIIRKELNVPTVEYFFDPIHFESDVKYEIVRKK